MCVFGGGGPREYQGTRGEDNVTESVFPSTTDLGIGCRSWVCTVGIFPAGPLTGYHVTQAGIQLDTEPGMILNPDPPAPIS